MHAAAGRGGSSGAGRAGSWGWFRFGRRGMKGDPLYQARRTLHTGDKLLTDRQRSRLEALFAAEEHVEVEATWGI